MLSTDQVTVVVPAYDAQDTLRQQLLALRAQGTGSTAGWEVLVCDNGSSDGTRALVQEMAADWPRLRLVDASARRGPGAARNIGAQAARGRYLLFCDADDMVGTGWLATMSAALHEHPMVAGRIEGDLLNVGSRMRSHRTIQDSELFTKPFLPGLRAAGAGNLGVRREVFLALGGFSEETSVGEDVDLCWRAQLSGYTLAFVPGAVVHVRKRDTVRGLWRQAYAYGVGDRWLMARFARVEPVGAVQTAQVGVPTSRPPEGADIGAAVAGPPDSVPPRRALDVGRARRLAARGRRVLRVRHPGDLADWVFAAGVWCGARTGRVDAPTPWLPPARAAADDAVVRREPAMTTTEGD